MSDSDPVVPTPYNARVALNYAERGFGVFPCWERTTPQHKAKSPCTSRGFKDATLDPHHIRRLWAQHPEALPGLDLGSAGVFAIDGDRHEGGEDGVTAFEQLAEAHGYDLSVHPTVMTPGNGKHWYFRAPAGSVPSNGTGNLPSGVDVRWAGYTIAPWSRLPNGRFYARDETTPALTLDLPEASEWLMRTLGEAKTKALDNQTPLCELDTPPAIATAIEILRADQGAVDGAGGNNHTYALACRVRDRGISEAECLNLMLEYWNDRCSGPWEPDDLAKIVASAYRHARSAPGSASPLVVFGEISLPADFHNLPSKSGTITADVLARKQFAPVRFVVPAILPEGLALLAGKPKFGKSFLALQVAIAVASGSDAFGSLPVDAGDVLYCALEDSERRLSDRLKQMCPGNDAVPSRLHFKTGIKRLGMGCERELRNWLGEHPDAKLIILDTWVRIKPESAGRSSAYDEDARGITPLHDIAKSHPGLCILVIHHTRKMDADDPFDTISGTFGLTGVADTLVVLTRQGRLVKLCGQGRDIEGYEKALSRVSLTGGWSIEGDAREVAKTGERQAILDALAEADGLPMTAREVADAIEHKYDAVRRTLNRMAVRGEIARGTKRGTFTLLEALEVVPTVPTVSTT